MSADSRCAGDTACRSPALASALRLGYLITCALLVAACGEAVPPTAELSGLTMGTSYSIKLTPPPPQDEQLTLARLIDARLAEINDQMSTYLADSDLMRFNSAATTDWQAVPVALVDLVAHAIRVSELSGGAYDITVGPLVNLWGFGSTGVRDTPPPETEITEALAQVGYRRLAFRRSPPALRKAVGGLQIDLSSIAKGWAVDQIAELLAEHGLENYLVEIGGEVYAHGEKQPGRAWRIAIEQPLEDRREAMQVVPLRDMAMATSGDYRNFFTAQGRRYSHTIDPGTGQAVRHRLASVTLFADNCTDADAWATALLALGEQRGPALADELGLKALFVVRTDQGFSTQASAVLRRAAWWPGQARPQVRTARPSASDSR